MLAQAAPLGEVDGLRQQVRREFVAGLRVHDARTRAAPATDPTEECRALRDARLDSDRVTGARGVLVASCGERLVEEEEHGQHLAPEKAAPHRVNGAS
jgi:hypothetical protein